MKDVPLDSANTIPRAETDVSTVGTAGSNATRTKTDAKGAETICPSNDPKHAVLLRFKNRTALSLGNAQTRLAYARVVPGLALRYGFLFHAVTATTLLHDRALTGAQVPQHDELHHLGQAAALLNHRLSTKIVAAERDAIWATSAYLCASTIFNISTTVPQHTWPLESSNQNSLEWLTMQAGLRIVWQMTEMNRQDSAFSQIEPTTPPSSNCVHPTEPIPGINGILPILVTLCGLDKNSTGENNPYHTAASRLTTLLAVPGTPDNVLTFMVFAGGMKKEFRALLHKKDPRALLLLALWYSKLFHSMWWVVPRARLECQAICQYLGEMRVQERGFQQVLGVVRKASETLELTCVAELVDLLPRLPVEKKVANGPTSMKVEMFWDGY
ncbi:hypothetical protein LTR64_004597 [Lithohypha guttulata]|uniref:uncharacterized protein n=1 Tax=Lithohypha guttulata TaxID=1690604 RepID=UPI00315CA838